MSHFSFMFLRRLITWHPLTIYFCGIYKFNTLLDLNIFWIKSILYFVNWQNCIPRNQEFFISFLNEGNRTPLTHYWQISPEDIRWESEDAGLSHRGGHGGGRRGRKPSNHRGVIPGAGRGRGEIKAPSKKEIHPSQNGIGKVSDDLELLNTDTLVKEVCRMKLSLRNLNYARYFHFSLLILLGGESFQCKWSRSFWAWKSKENAESKINILNPFSPFSSSLMLEFDIYMLQMQDHEQALVDAIARLAYASDGESGNGYMCT